MPHATKTPSTPRHTTRSHAGTAGSTAEPLWRQVVQALRGDILRGVFRVGAQLPTEEELSERFGVSRHTVREALRQLRSDGLVSSRRGSGTTVMPAQPSTSFNVHRVASIDELIAYASESRYVVEQAAIVGSAELPAEALGLPSGSQWLRMQGLRFKESGEAAPICWTTVLVAQEFAGVERLVHSQRGPIWRLIEDMYGERLVEIDQMLRVQTVDDAIADKLQVAVGSAVVEVRRTYRNTRGQVIEISINLYPAEPFVFNMKLRRA
jgi:GntR family transcriptional regulator